MITIGTHDSDKPMGIKEISRPELSSVGIHFNVSFLEPVRVISVHIDPDTIKEWVKEYMNEDRNS